MMQLRDKEPGPAQVAKQLRDLASRKHGVWNNQLEFAVNAFIAWVNEIERTLRSYFVDPCLNDLFTARYWHIFDGGSAIPRLGEVIRAEAEWQSDRLETLATELEAVHRRFKADKDTTLAVVDTNVFLHCKPLDEIDWAFVALGPARLVVPLRVIEELDEKRRDRDKEIIKRSRASVRWLRDRLINSDSRVPLTGSVSIEAFVPTGHRTYQATADTEILQACDTLSVMTGAPVVIVTADLGMQLRGSRFRPDGTGFKVMEVPADYQID